MRRLGCTVAACSSMATHSHCSGNATGPICRFGLIADIQYAPIDAATNFAGTETRDYRGALVEAKRAVDYWNSMKPGIDFVAQLGDLIDGQNAGGYGQLKGQPPISEESLRVTLHELLQCKVKFVEPSNNEFDIYYVTLTNAIETNVGPYLPRHREPRALQF